LIRHLKNEIEKVLFFKCEKNVKYVFSNTGQECGAGCILGLSGQVSHRRSWPRRVSGQIRRNKIWRMAVMLTALHPCIPLFLSTPPFLAIYLLPSVLLHPI